MSCPICDIIDHEVYVIYQDKFAVAYLSQDPAAEGHVIVAPREHIPILEQMPDDLLTHLFIVANRVSTSVFELFGAQGTNITVNNGLPAGQDTPHFMINVIPRKETDALNFQWTPKQVSALDMKTVAAKVKDKCDYIGHETPKKEPVDMDKKEEIDSTAEEVDQRVKHLERVP